MNLELAKVKEIAEAVKAKKITAKEVCQYFLDQANKWQDKTNALISINPNAIKQAEEIDKKIQKGESLGKLAGVPVVIKDLLCTKDLQTTAASKMLSNFIPPYSATIVERLQEAGAVVLAKANLDEFAMGSSNENSFYGNVKNPWNLDYVPGGSSGGSAAAVACRIAPIAIGTDTGGSIRQPASFCNIVGIKPTYGRVSRYGIIAFASSLDQAGPMTNYVEDAALCLEIIAGKDPKDSTSANIAVPEFSNLKQDISGLKIGLPKEYFAEGLDDEVRKVCEQAIENLKKCGVTFVEVQIPHLSYAVAAYYIIATSEASSNLARYDGVRYGYRSKEAKTLEDLYCNSRGEAFGPEVKRRIMLGTFALSSGYHDAHHEKACKVRKLVQDDFIKAFDKCDLLLSPVTTSPAFKIGDRCNDPLAMYLNDIYTTSTNLAGIPGISVPGGFSKNNLPIGIQLNAPHFKEETIFSVANEIEKSSDCSTRRPN